MQATTSMTKVTRGRCRDAVQLTGSSGCPHAHVYVVPCGHGVLIWISHGQSSLSQVRRVPAVLSAWSMPTRLPVRSGHETTLMKRRLGTRH